MNEEEKPTDAEEIVSELQKKKEEQGKQNLSESESKPEPDVAAPEPASEPEPAAPASEPEPAAPSSESAPSLEQTSAAKPSGGDDNETRVRNVIFVGVKPIMTYVTATLTQLSSEPTVTIKARGKRITQAVDVSQMIVKRMNTVGYKIGDVRIASDSLTSQDGKQRNVSTIEIDITKT